MSDKGYVGAENVPPSEDEKDKTVEKTPSKKKPWWKFWVR